MILNVYPGGMIYVSQYVPIDYTLAMCMINDGRAHAQGALSGFTREEAWARVQALCGDLGLAPQLWNYTAMDAAKLEEAYKIWQDDQRSFLEQVGMLFERPKQALKAPDEGYFFEVFFTFDGLGCNRVPTQTNSFSEISLGSSAVFYVTKERGVIWLEAEPNAAFYEIVERVEGAKNKPSMDMEAAIQALVKNYELLILNEPVVIERIAYEYLAVPGDKANHFLMRPVWGFYPVAGGRDELEPVYVDAINGKMR